MRLTTTHAGLLARTLRSVQILWIGAMLVGCGEPPAVASNWHSLASARTFIEARKHNGTLQPPAPLSESDWKLILGLLAEKDARVVGRFLGAATDRPHWVADAVIDKFTGSVGVVLGKNYQPPGPQAALYYERIGAFAFFLEVRGAGSRAFEGLVLLLRRLLAGEENFQFPESQLLRIIARVCSDDPQPLIRLMSDPAESRLIRARMCEALVLTAGAWGKFREPLVKALLLRVFEDDEPIAAEAVRALGENKWIGPEALAHIRERFERMGPGAPKAGIQRWIETARR